MKGQKAA